MKAKVFALWSGKGFHGMRYCAGGLHIGICVWGDVSLHGREKVTQCDGSCRGGIAEINLDEEKFDRVFERAVISSK